MCNFVGQKPRFFLDWMEQEFASTLLERAVSEFAKLPGIGRKTALRLVLYLLKQPVADVRGFG
jgi:recombination protein RecR